MEQLNIKHSDDTICAISTPAGVGGIAVIRVSGEQAVEMVMKSWKGADLTKVASHTLHLGRIVDANGEILDEVVAAIFRGPNSFTGEDVVELSCHGSLWIQQQLVALLIDNGCRAAEGGEFTRRAFMNGRMDLSQAEAVADVIASSSRASHRIAVSQMRGGFSRMLASLREQLLEFVSLMELELDFSEEDVEFADRTHLIELAEHIEAVIGSLAESFAVGNAIKNGFPVAIVGETNAGKSTLLNRLLHDDKALVSDIRGTTRDVIEDTINLGGLTFRFIDTAGIRETTDTIESMGIERTFKKLDEATIVLWMIDGTQPADNIRTLAPEIVEHTDGKHLIAVLNKIDCLTDSQRADLHQVIGVKNKDEISKKYRPFKQIEERLNRTYKQNYYGTNGYDKIEGANSYMILFVCFFNFLRQHSALKYKTPVTGLFDNNMLMPDQWLKLIEISHKYHPADN